MQTILIVDDDENIGNLEQEVLERAGYGVRRAYSGTEALLLLENERFDLVLLDLMLPGALRSGRRAVFYAGVGYSDLYHLSHYHHENLSGIEYGRSAERMKNRVITISREFGSGGRTIGKKVAEKLGIPCYDAEIIQEMAKETGFAPDYVKEAGEYAPGSFLSSAFSNRMFGPTNEDILWEHQYKVITDIAAKGPCVIVGRCADYILQNKADCLKIFIHADMKFRAERIVKVYGERKKSA